jgi:hypothetical protein
MNLNAEGLASWGEGKRKTSMVTSEEQAPACLLSRHRVLVFYKS